MKNDGIAKLAVLIVCLVLINLVIACSLQSGSDKKNINTIKGDWPTPSSYISELPVYDSFDQIESLFHINNDTTYIINFWATWCKPCVEELPYFEELHVKSKGTKTKVVLISLDFPNHINSKLVPYIKVHQLTAHILVLLDGKFNTWIDKVSPEWDGTIPATYIYRQNKKQFISGAFDSVAEIEEMIARL